MKHIAMYLRVLTKRQDTRSQKPDLEQWAAAYANGTPVKWYRDAASGKTMDRPGWKKLEVDIAAGKVEKVVCWRLDRLGRTASGLTKLFDDLRECRVGLVSVRDGLDLSTAAGRMMAGVLASVAQYETEIRAERVLAGQQRARAAGKTWGGSQKGRRSKEVAEKAEIVQKLHAEGMPVTKIARTVGVSRPTVYSLIKG